MNDTKRTELLTRISRIDQDIAAFEAMLANPEDRGIENAARNELRRLRLFHDVAIEDLKKLNQTEG